MNVIVGIGNCLCASLLFILLHSLLMHILFLATSHWCISRSYGHPLVLSSQEMGGLTGLGEVKEEWME